MRTVIKTAPGVVELNYMWLPTFVGMNSTLKWKMEQRLKPKLEGKELTNSLLDEANELVIKFLCEEFPVEGLGEHLRSLRKITDG